MVGALFFAVLLAADDKEAEAALERFKAAYRSDSATARALAVAELCTVPHEKTLARVAPLLTGGSKDVRIAAARGLGKFADFKKHVTPILIGSLAPNDKEPDVVAAIFEGLGMLGDENALPTIHKHFEDKDSKIANAALAAAGVLRHVSSIDPIVELMKDYEKQSKVSTAGGAGLPAGDDRKKKLAVAVLPATIKAMKAITREKWATTGEWVIWWGRRKAQNYKVPE